MRRILSAVAVIVLTAGMAAASDTNDVMASVNQFISGFNKGDAKSMVASCADQASAIDDFPPHAWQGAGACQMWMNDYEAYAKKNGETGGVVTLGKPWHVDVTGDRAYVVAPATFTYKKNGKPMSESGATFTSALQKGSSGWRITAWAWGAH
jgi:ketosteroid isomerase-like protein